MPAGWVAAAVAGSAIIGGIASSNAASDQEASANQANATLEGQYNSNVARNAPFTTAGTGAVNTLADMEGTSGNTTAPSYGSLNGTFTAQDYLNNQDPGYQFQLQQGSNALQSRDATTGSAIGGAAMKDLLTYNQNYASTGYQNAFDRYQTNNTNVYNRLAGLAGIGQASANNTSQSGNALAGAESANTVGAGNAAAAGTVGVANAASSGLSGAGYYAAMNGLNGTSTSTTTAPVTSSSTYSGGYTGGAGTDFISG